MGFICIIIFISILHQINGKDPKIVGGRPARQENWKFLVGLRRVGINAYKTNNTVPYCGGTLLSSTCVVTAAHCLYNRYENTLVDINVVKVTAGSVNSRTPYYVSDIAVAILHPGYENDQSINDIAIIRLSTPMDKSKTVDYARLARKHIPPGIECRTAGWGTMDAWYPRPLGTPKPQKDRTKEGKSKYEIFFNEREFYLRGFTVPQFAREVYLTTISLDECRQIYASENLIHTNKIFCTLERRDKKDTCQGDSGGPILCNNQLAGITSWGAGCATAVYPSVYTSVPDYADWIVYKCNASIEELQIKYPVKKIRSNLSKASSFSYCYIICIQIFILLLLK